MKSNRYIITRSCLDDATIRLLSYNESLFKTEGAAIFRDEYALEFPVHIDHKKKVVHVGSFYEHHHLGVNDVLMIHLQSQGYYRVDFIVKPHGLTKSSRSSAQPRPVAMSRVREITPPKIEQRPPSEEDCLTTWAVKIGYHVEYPASGLLRLHTSHHSILIAVDPIALMQPAWEASFDDAQMLLTRETESSQGFSCVTQEALNLLHEYAYLLNPSELAHCWKLDRFDRSVAEELLQYLIPRGQALFTEIMHSLVGRQTVHLSELQSLDAPSEYIASVMHLLTQPPFLALIPLGEGAYRLRTDIHSILNEWANYAMTTTHQLQEIKTY